MIRSVIHASASRWRRTGSVADPFVRAVSVITTSSFSNASCWPSVDAPRSNARVPVAHRARRQVREAATRVGFAVALAPDLGAGEDAGQELGALRVVAEVHD